MQSSWRETLNWAGVVLVLYLSLRALLAVFLEGVTEAGSGLSTSFSLWSFRRVTLKLNRGCPSFVPELESLRLRSSRRETLKLGQGCFRAIPEPESLCLRSSRRETLKLGRGCPSSIPEPESLCLGSSRRETLKLGRGCTRAIPEPESLRLRSSRRETLKLGPGKSSLSMALCPGVPPGKCASCKYIIKVQLLNRIKSVSEELSKKNLLDFHIYRLHICFSTGTYSPRFRWEAVNLSTCRNFYVVFF